MIVTSNKPFSAWGEIFGDDAVATAMLDRLVHHADILALKGDSYRLRGKDLDARPPPATASKTPDRSPSATALAGPQTALQRLDPEPEPRQTPRTRPEARLGATRLPALPAARSLPAPPSGPLFDRRQLVHFSTGLERPTGLTRW